MERQKFIKLMRARGHWRNRSQDSAEIMSYLRENDNITVTLNEQPRGFWVDGEPCPTQLPIINPIQTTKPVCHVCELGFSTIRTDCTAEKLIAADNALSEHKYVFIGYHGTNKKNFNNMCQTGLDEMFCGTGEGQAKGSGFYIARSVRLADEYADVSTQSGDPEPPHYIVPHYEGEKGVKAIVRVYAKNFSIFEIGIDMAWGIESSCGDPFGDKKISKLDTDDSENGYLKSNQHHLEIVIAPHMYKFLAILPLLNNEIGSDSKLMPMANWPSHFMG